jgi:hypothetical protein
MGKKPKPNFTSFGNKKSGKQKSFLDALFPATPPKAKRVTKKTHHDGKIADHKRTGGRGGKRY